MINVVLNVTKRCNLRCPDCNQLCNLFPNRDEDMSVDQVKRFIAQAKGVPMGHILVSGGEPLLHPQITEILDLLLESKLAGVKVNTSGVINLTPWSGRPIKWLANLPTRKKHISFMQAAVDHGTPWVCCRSHVLCGFNLDCYGYTPCAPGATIIRAFGLEHLYRDELPTEVWGMEELCKYCGHGLVGLKDRPLSMAGNDVPSASWSKTLAGYNGGIRTRRTW